MSPVAIMDDRNANANASPKPTSPSTPFRPIPHDAMNISRHPSPWHEIAHTLSATPPTTTTSVSVSRRGSSPTLQADTNPLPICNHDRSHDQALPSPLVTALSSSQALRDWEARLASPDSDVRRHQLVHPPLPPNHQGGQTQLLIPIGGSPILPPKLAAERDKEGHIEYKLKLIDPSQERFGKLVTQMKWRLSQGKNEAIYELGLADDGTVVGLTRAEMDASLRTLEAMASELGATVMILREIVLSGAPSQSVTDISSGISDLSSSITSASSAQSPNLDSRWPVKRPDLDDFGRPKKGTRTLSGTIEDVEKPRITKKPIVDNSDIIPQYTARQVIFNLSPSTGDEESDTSATSSPGASLPVKQTTPGSDDDIPPFELDLDDKLSAPVPDPAPHGRSWGRQKKKPVSEQMSIDPKKFDAKRTKLAKRREERRLDLLRGDGMSTTWLDLQSSDSPISQPTPTPASNLTSQLLAKIPHQPARPSSLRLASPAPSTSTIRPAQYSAAEGLDDDGSLWGLSQTPLDSLSLSFADVQVQDISPVSSPGTAEDSWQLETSLTALPTIARPLTGREMVCVEALVVRKVQHGHGADGEGGSEEEECGWGGVDDVWGLGVDSD